MTQAEQALFDLRTAVDVALHGFRQGWVRDSMNMLQSALDRLDYPGGVPDAVREAREDLGAQG